MFLDFIKTIYDSSHSISLINITNNHLIAKTCKLIYYDINFLLYQKNIVLMKIYIYIIELFNTNLVIVTKQF